MHCLLLSAVLLLAAASGARAAIWEWPLGPYGVLRFDVPTGWTAKSQEPEAPVAMMMPSIRAVGITPPQGIPLRLLVTPYPLPDSTGDTLLEDGARAVVSRMQTVAEEPVLEAKPFEGEISRGFSVSATHKRVTQPTGQDFKYVIRGQLVTGRVFATFSILTNLPSGPERERALEIVRSAWHEPTALPIADKNGTVALALSDRAWRLLIDLPGFVFEPIQPLGQRRGMRLAGNNSKSGVNFSAFLDPTSPGRAAVDQREEHWTRIQPTGPFTDVRRSERDGMALLARTFPGAAGFRLDQRHVNAHMVHDGVWIDVHLSKVHYTPQDDALFEAVIKTIRIAKKGIADVDYDQAVLRLEPKRPLVSFGRGNVYFKRGEYDKAIADVTEVIRLEPDFAGAYKARALAHRRKGEAERAIADYTEVIRLEPDKSLGYFGRGSVHQERGEHDKALADFDQVIRLDPKHDYAYEQRGRAYEQKGQREEAIADFRKALSLPAAAAVHQRSRDGLKRLGASP